MQNWAWTFLLAKKKFAPCSTRVHFDAARRNPKLTKPAAPVSPITFPLKGKHVSVLLACGFEAAMLRDKISAECAGTKKRTL